MPEILLQKKEALSLEAPLVEVVSEADRTDVALVIAVVGAEVTGTAALLLIELVEDEVSTISVFVELALVLTELTSLPPSPHWTTVSQPPAKVSSQYDDWLPRAK